MANKIRADHEGPFRMAYLKNKKKVMRTQDTCALCGRYVDKSLKYPDPMCATVDHIIPLNRGGHPSDISNLQLAHLCCNRAKSDNIVTAPQVHTITIAQTHDWKNF